MDFSLFVNEGRGDLRWFSSVPIDPRGRKGAVNQWHGGLSEEEEFNAGTKGKVGKWEWEWEFQSPSRRLAGAETGER